MVKRLVDYLSRLFKTDLAYILKGGGFLSIPQITSAFISLGLTVAFANLLPVETYGTYRYVLSVYSLLAVLALPGMDTAIIQSVSRGFEGSLIKGLNLKFRWGLLGSLASFVYAIYNFAVGNQILGVVFIVVGIALPFMESLTIYSAFLNGKKIFKIMAITEIINQVFSATTLIIVLLLTDNLMLIMPAYYLPYIIGRGLFYLFVKKKYLTNTNNDPGLFKYAKSVSLFHVLSRTIMSIDQIVLFHILGPVQVAIFGLAMAIPMRAIGLLRIMGTITLPIFATRDYHAIAKTMPKKLLYFSSFILLGGIVYFFIAPYLFKYLFPQYMPSIDFSKVIIFYTLSAISYPFSALLFAHKKMKEIYIMTTINFAVKVIALFVFVPIFGIWGAVISVLGAAASTIIVSLYFLKKFAAYEGAINQ